MFHKKLMACLLLSGVSHSCFGMELVGSAVNAVRSGINTASEKMYPTEIFKTIHQEWDTADDRTKMTLLQKLNRGFVDGFIKQEDLTKLLDAIEDTIPRYPINIHVLNILHGHIVIKLPTLDSRLNVKTRALKAMYLIKPEQLALDIEKSRFTNYTADSTQRETIVSHIAQSIINSGNALQANQLVRALESKKEIPFGTTAQKDLKAFLSGTATQSYKSCEFIDGLRNTVEDEHLKQLAMAAIARATSQQEKLKLAQESHAREEKALADQFQALQDKSNEIRRAVAQENAAVIKESAVLEALKTKLFQIRAEKEAAQESVREADNSNNE